MATRRFEAARRCATEPVRAERCRHITVGVGRDAAVASDIVAEDIERAAHGESNR
jgi:hypothetical protein